MDNIIRPNRRGRRVGPQRRLARKATLQGNLRILSHPSHPQIRRAASRFDPVDTPATLAGSTKHFHVFYAERLGPSGASVARGVLKNCERDYQTLAEIFMQQGPLQFNIIIAPLSEQMDGTGGAYHHSCLATDLYCDVQLTPTIDPDVTNALMIAEEVEVFQAARGRGWECGASNGEGLSRVLAEELYPNVLENLGYSSAASWLNSRHPNLVGRTLPTDRTAAGNGCAVLFLHYLHFQLGFSYDKISQAAAPTLAGTYKALTGKKAPFAEFAALLEKRFPRGQRADLATDNPFPINEASPVAQTKRPLTKTKANTTRRETPTPK
jgi:hypothetical protein